MGRHRLEYKLKKPNAHHKYWRYVLSSDPKQSEISTQTKVKYEAERIAKDVCAKAKEEMTATPLFGDYAKDFFTSKCQLVKRRNASSKPFTQEMLALKRSHVVKYLIPAFGQVRLKDITTVGFEDWRLTLQLANSTRNGITITMNHVMNEAVRDGHLMSNPLRQVECLSKQAANPRDSLNVQEFEALFPQDVNLALRIWGDKKYLSLLFLMVSSGMRSGEIRALRWADILWEESGVLVTKAVKNTGKVGSVKEKKEKVVRLAARTLSLLRLWNEEAEPVADTDYVFWAQSREQPIGRAAILRHFKAGLERAGIKGKNLVPHSLRHTFNTHSLSYLPREVVQRFTGHSTEQMSNRYNHPLLKQQLKATEGYQQQIDAIWGDSSLLKA